nr:tp53 regulating kinase [Hymenolepis microstoma]
MQNKQASGDTIDYLTSLAAPAQPPGELIRQGAEARVYSVPNGCLSTFPDLACIVKERFVKTYRHPALDSSLSLRRMRAEARQLVKCRQLGIPVPALLLVNMSHRQLWMENVCTPYGMSLGQWIHDILELEFPSNYLCLMAKNLGKLLAKMHANCVIHGDLTTANILVQMDKLEDKLENYRLFLIDFGLSSVNQRAAQNVHDEEIAVDLYVLERALISALATRKTQDEFEFTPESFFEAVLESYKDAYPKEAITRPMETPGLTANSQKAANNDRKRPRCDSNTWISSLEDGKKEVDGILRTLKDVQARGRKRIMIG